MYKIYIYSKEEVQKRYNRWQLTSGIWEREGSGTAVSEALWIGKGLWNRTDRMKMNLWRDWKWPGGNVIGELKSVTMNDYDTSTIWNSVNMNIVIVSIFVYEYWWMRW